MGYTDTMVGYGQDTPAMPETPADPLEHYRYKHRELRERHKDLTGQLIAALEKDCNRLEREIRDMAAYLDTIHASQPVKEQGGYR